MRLPFQRSKPASEAPPAPSPRVRQRRSRGATGAAAPDAAVVDAARTRARRRLVGALVLLAIGVIGFPLLFETRPRPLPVDTPIELSPRDGAPPSAAPDVPVAAGPATLAAAPVDDAVESSGPASSAAAPPVSQPTASMSEAMAASALASARPSPAPSRPQPQPAPPPPAAKEAPRSDDGARALALLDGKASSPAAARFVVQVGAFADAATLHEARAKVEKLGLKTYTQVVDNAAGRRTRVRVGPFASRADAEAAAARVRHGGLPASIVAL